jgi:hypothetical protein
MKQSSILGLAVTLLARVCWAANGGAPAATTTNWPVAGQPINVVTPMVPQVTVPRAATVPAPASVAPVAPVIPDARKAMSQPPPPRSPRVLPPNIPTAQDLLTKSIRRSSPGLPPGGVPAAVTETSAPPAAVGSESPTNAPAAQPLPYRWGGSAD